MGIKLKFKVKLYDLIGTKQNKETKVISKTRFWEQMGTKLS